jgi:hypothetical protein
MKIIDWANSSPDARRAALARPAADSREAVFREANAIIAAVRAEGDAGAPVHETAAPGSTTCRSQPGVSRGARR